MNPSITRLASLIVAGILAVAFTACNLSSPDGAGQRSLGPSEAASSYADSLESFALGGYMIVEREGVPRLEGDSLYVMISYSGCGPGFDATLEYVKTGPSSYELGLYQERVTTCAMPWSETKAYKVPDEVRDAQSVRLVVPDGRRVALREPTSVICGLE